MKGGDQERQFLQTVGVREGFLEEMASHRLLKVLKCSCLQRKGKRERERERMHVMRQDEG